MAFEHKPGSFSLFRNEHKKAGNHPDYKGEGKDLDGKPIEVAAWTKKGAKGDFLSCTFKPKAARADRDDKPPPEPCKHSGPDFDDDDSMPF